MLKAVVDRITGPRREIDRAAGGFVVHRKRVINGCRVDAIMTCDASEINHARRYLFGHIIERKKAAGQSPTPTPRKIAAAGIREHESRDVEGQSRLSVSS